MKRPGTVLLFGAEVCLIALLAGCGVLGQGKPTPLPTLMLDTPAPAISTGSRTSEVKNSSAEAAASGNVVPARRVQLAFATGGLVKEMSAVEGGRVKAGQVLARLAGGDKINAAIEAARLELLSAQQALQALKENADQARAAAQQRLAKANKALDDAQKRRLWRNYRNGSDSVVQTAEADLILATDRLKHAREDYDSVSSSPDDSVIKAGALSALAAAQKAYDRALANLNYVTAMPTTLEVDQAEADLQVAKAEVASAQKEYDKLKNGPDPDALALAEERVKNDQTQISAIQATLTDLELKAPFDGTVGRISLHEGEWTAPGQPVLLLLDLDRLQVETTDLSERDVPKVEAGQPVMVLVKSLNVEIKGQVVEIASLADILGGDVVYKATIDLSSIPKGLRAGMSVEVQFGVGN